MTKHLECEELIKEFEAVLPFERDLRNAPEWDPGLVTRDYTVRRLCSTKPKLGGMLAFVERVKRSAKVEARDVWLSDCLVRLILTCADKLKSSNSDDMGRTATLLKTKRDENCIDIAHEWFERQQSGEGIATASAAAQAAALRPGTASQQSRRPKSAQISSAISDKSFVTNENALGQFALPNHDHAIKKGALSPRQLPPRPQSAAVARMGAGANILRGFRKPNLYRSHAERLRRSRVPGSLEDIRALETLAMEVDAISRSEAASERPETAPDEDIENAAAMAWLDNMWNEKRERELKASRRKDEVKRALEKWEQQRVMLEQRARARRRNRVRGARLALENRMKAQEDVAAAARPETAPQTFRYRKETAHISDEAGGIPTPEEGLPREGLLLHTVDSTVHGDEDGSRASTALDSEDEAERLAKLPVDAESSMGPLQSMEQPPMHFGTALPLSMSRPSVESIERFGGRGIGKVVDVSNVDVVRAGIKGMKLLRAQKVGASRVGSGPDALLVPEDSQASATASKMFHEEAGDVVEETFGADELRLMLHEAQIHEVEAIRLAFEKVGLKPPTKALERALIAPHPAYRMFGATRTTKDGAPIIPMVRVGENLPANPFLAEKIAIFGHLVKKAKKKKKRKGKKKKGKKRKGGGTKKKKKKRTKKKSGTKKKVRKKKKKKN